MTEAPKKPKKESKSFLRLIGEAAVHTPNMVVVGAAGVGAVALHSIPIAALGGATYLAMIAWDMVSPDFWKKKNAEAEKKSAGALSSSLPSERELTSAPAKAALQLFVKAKAQLERTLAETPDAVKVRLTSVILIEAELEQRAATLLRRADALDRSLRGLTGGGTGGSGADLDVEIRKLALQERDAGDPGAREQYRAARMAREEQRKALAELEASYERCHANLTRIVAVLESLAVKVAHLRAVDDAAMDSLAGDMGKELDDVNIEMRAFEESLAGLSA